MKLVSMLDMTIYVRKKNETEPIEKSLVYEIPIELNEKQKEKFFQTKNDEHKRLVLQSIYQSSYLDKELKKIGEFKGYEQVGWKTCVVLSFKEESVPKKRGRSPKEK